MTYLGGEIVDFYMGEYGGSLGSFIETLEECDFDENDIDVFGKLEEFVNSIGKEIAVIGNIHQNPELINKDERR